MNTFLLLQLADSAFPTGGFAHASGLEGARALGLVSDAEGFALYAREVLRAAGYFALPFASAAYEAPEALVPIDARCEAATPGHVANRASRAQGQALLRAAAATLGPRAIELAGRARETASPGHLAPVHGAVLRLAGASREEMATLLLFGALRGLLAAAVRLGVAGPMEAQALQASLAPEAEAVRAACAGLTMEEAAQPSPLVDLAQSHQDRLYSRLFQS